MQLILGGARSGKSRYAEGLAQQQEAEGKKVVYIATATHAAGIDADDQKQSDEQAKADAAFAERIAQHQAQRPAHWTTVEEPHNLAQAIEAHDAPTQCILVDCLTLWLLNCQQASDFSQQKQALLQVVQNLQGQLLLVSNEIGLGVLPMGTLTREYVDELGLLHQALAAKASQVVVVVAGLPMVLKS